MTAFALRTGWIAVLLSVCLCSARVEAAYFFTVGTTMAGPQVQVDVNHTHSWSFKVDQPVTISGGLFMMKVGSQTDTGVTFSLIAGTTSLMEVSLDPPQLTQQFELTTFAGGPVDLSPGQTYTASLLSHSPDPQAFAFFLKDPSHSAPYLVDDSPPSNDNPPSNNSDPPAITLVNPEPASVLVWSALALVGAAFGRRRFRKPRAA